MSKLITIILFLSLANIVSAQVHSDFLQHLQQERLQLEEYTYLNSLNISNTETQFLKSDYYLRYEQDSLFLNTFNAIKEEYKKDTARTTLASAYFLKNKKHRSQWFKQISTFEQHIRLSEIFTLYNAANIGSNLSISKLPEPLHDSYSQYEKAHQKSPLLAASLSAIIPGLGKAYNGKPRRFFATFLTNSMLMYQTYESINKLGPKNVLSITNMIIASIFYAANVYGSYKDIKLFKRESKNQLLIDASNYYSSEYHTDKF